MTDDKARENSHSATHEPWKEPGQTSQDKSIQPPKDAVEQKKRQKQDR